MNWARGLGSRKGVKVSGHSALVFGYPADSLVCIMIFEDLCSADTRILDRFFKRQYVS